MRSSFAVCVALLLCSSVCLAQPVVVIDSMSGGLCGEPSYYEWSTHYISICNPEVIQERLLLYFTVTSDAGFRWGYPPEIEFYNRFDSLWLASNYGNLNMLVTEFVELDIHTYHLALWVRSIPDDPNLPPAIVEGLPVSQDTIPYIGIRLRAGSFGGQLCLDSVSTYADSSWSAHPGPAPLFSGEVCYTIGEGIPDYDCSSIDDYGMINGVYRGLWVLMGWSADTTFSVPDICTPLEIVFTPVPVFPYGLQPDEIEWSIEGPGTLEWADNYGWPGSLKYGFLPDQSQANQTFQVQLYSTCPYCEITLSGVRLSFEVAVGDIDGVDDPVHFVYSSPVTYGVLSGDTLRVTMPVEDDGPCYNHVYSFHYSPEDPLPPGASINSDTGEVTYVGAPADTGKYWIYVDVEELGHVATKYFMISHFDQVSCGDCDHNGSIDVGDLTWLISFLFMQGPSPIPEGSGDVDCAPGIDVADLTALISHLFITFDPLCDGC